MAEHVRTSSSSSKPSAFNYYQDYDDSADHMFAPRTTRDTRNTRGSHGSLQRINTNEGKPTIRMQETPASPVSISPPRSNLREPSSAQVSFYSPPNPARHVYTPDSVQGSARLADSISNLSLQEGGVMAQDLDPTEQVEQFEPPVQLQYAHALFDDSPKKKDVKKAYRVSQMTMQSAVSSSSGGDNSRLGPPNDSSTRPMSQASLGSELRERNHTPLSTEDRRSWSGSPQTYARNASATRKSPDFRPMSYIDLLNEVPYSQQVAPAPAMNNSSLQMAVGNSASLLDTKKTMDMYRANVKKTNDPAIQYEFAIFMVNAARDAMAHEQQTGVPVTPRPDSAAEMLKEARSILQRLADRGYPFAQYYLGDGYFSGLFNKGKPDYGSAFPLFVAASKHGHAEAGYRAALCYEFGWGTSQSFPKAVQFFRNAASKGHPGAAVRLGKACLTGDMGLVNKYREGIKWLKRAAESADAQYNSGPYELGLLHMTGFGDDVFKDESYAAQLFTQGAELGHPEANFEMGQAYENGTLGCPRDAALSVHFYNGAATAGLPEAMMALCAWYMVGAEPVLEKDEVEAFEWAKKAAECGLPKAEYAVGYFTEMGIGCRRDPLEANVWYVKAADKGNATARQRLDIIRAAAAGGTLETAVPMTKAAVKSQELGAKDKGKECIVM